MGKGNGKANPMRKTNRSCDTGLDWAVDGGTVGDGAREKDPGGNTKKTD